MKKTFKYIAIFTALLISFTGCIKEHFISEPSTDDIPYPTGGKAIVRMTVAIPGQVFPATKVMADTPAITNMRVVVFGSSGFLKENVEIDHFQSATTNGDATLYTFDAQLSLTDSKNLRVHVIANCEERFPWKYEDVVMSTYAYTSDNQDAYWARFTLPNGVTLKKVYNPDEDMMVYVKNGDGFFEVTDDVTAAFCGGVKTEGTPPVYNGLPLLRNFAKISVESTTPQLILNPTTTMAIINRPDRGSVAPYDTETGEFLYNYKESTYTQLKDNYEGFSPIGMNLIDDNPAAVAFSPCGKDGNGNVTGGVFMYERPKPTASVVPTYIIIHGTYYKLKQKYYDDGQPSNWKDTERTTPGTYLDLTDPKDCYYKIDLMDDDGYYAIFRNFRYHIRITNVSKEGADNPSDAGATGGTGDISQDQQVSGLTDISDGYGRIAVSYTGWTFVERQTAFEIKYKFLPDATTDTPNNALSTNGEGGPVTISFGDKSGPVTVFDTTLDSSISNDTGVTIGDDTNGRVRVMGTSTTVDAEGYRTIKFTVNSPDNAETASQVLRISGQIDQSRSIYRDVALYLMPRQTMTVECVADKPNPEKGEDYVEDITGEGVNVVISIPTKLPESMFPLIFNIESDKLSVTPNIAGYPDDNLPVERGLSICTGKENTMSFHYVRTLDYSEYTEFFKQNEYSPNMVFTCHFKTNKADSESTIYVDNQYFNKGNDQFYNYHLYTFSDLAFSNDNIGANRDLTFRFTLDPDDTYPSSGRTVKVKLDGLLPQNNSGLTPVPGSVSDLYEYTISSGRNGSLALRTLSGDSYDGTYSVTLNAEGADTKKIYHEASYGNTAQRITLNYSSLTMEVGDTKNLTATLRPATVATGTISWTSSNTSVATVNSEGKVTAVGVGSASITASCGGKSASCAVTVNETPVHRVILDKDVATIGIGNDYRITLTATVLPYNATNQTVSWSSSNTSVATVSSSGVVTGVSVGTTTITVTTADGGFTATCRVTVKRVTSKTVNTKTGTTGNNKTYSQAPASVTFSNIYSISNNNYVRPNSDSTITFTAGDNTMCKVVVNFTANNYTYEFPGGTLSGTAWTWVGEETSLVVTNTNNNTRRISSVVIYYFED